MWIPNGGRTNVTKMPPNKPHQFHHVVVSKGNKYDDASSSPKISWEYFICDIWGYNMTACILCIRNAVSITYCMILRVTEKGSVT